MNWVAPANGLPDSPKKSLLVRIEVLKPRWWSHEPLYPFRVPLSCRLTRLSRHEGMTTLRSQIIRLAHSMPPESPKRRILLAFMLDNEVGPDALQHAVKRLHEAQDLAHKKHYGQVRRLAQELRDQWRGSSAGSIKPGLNRLMNLADDANFASEAMGPHVEKQIQSLLNDLEKISKKKPQGYSRVAIQEGTPR